MIKEITQVVKDSMHFTGVVVQESTGSLTAQMKVIEADEFVDDDLDEEIRLTTKIVEACEAAGNVNTLPVRRSVPADISKTEHYSHIIDTAKLLAEVTIFQNTKMFRPSYLLISSDLLPVITFNPNFTIEPCTKINGIYTAGVYEDLPVLVLPTLDRGQMIWGINKPNASAVVTFVNNKGKVCNKIVSPDYLVLIKLED